MPRKKLSRKRASRDITTDDILGKDVIDAQGKIIGVVEKLFLDSSTLEFTGIGIDKGFLRKGIVVGRDYIERVSSVAIFLRITIAFDLKGRTVFDCIGAKVGVVSHLELAGEKNHIKKLHVRTGIRKKLEIPLEFVESMDHNIILGISKSQLVDYNNRQNA